jgi:hypothetical protein
MKERFVTTALLAVFVIGGAVLPAQVEPAPYITVHYDRIDPAMAAEFEANNKDWVDAFKGAKAGQDYYWRGYQSGFTYAWVSDMPNYGWIDDSDSRDKMLNEKLGEERMNELSAGASDAIVEHHTEIWKYQADMSYIPEGLNLQDMGAINVGIDYIKPGKGEEFRELVKEAVAAMKKIDAPVNFFAYSIPFGKGSYAFVSWAEDRAGLHGGPEFGKLLTEAIGEEKAKEIFKRYHECVADFEERDWRARRDISYVSDEMMEEKKAE